MKNERRDAALSYVRRGWEVFPSPPGTKAGYRKGRHLNSNPWGKTTDPAEVLAYWERWPRANIGIPMGAVSGIWDLEIDTREGHPDLVKDGAESLIELEAKHGKLPATLMFVSPTGSVHRLFRHPGGDVRIRTGPLDAKNFPGIDCKGDNSMSVAPPSRTSKGVYRWLNQRRIARAPAWLLELVTKPAHAPRELNAFEQYAERRRPHASIAEVTLACAMIPNPNHDWDTWNKIGMALFSATGGSAEGYRLFDAWSRRSTSKYDAGSTAKKWQALHGCPPHEIGAGTIFYLAEEAVPDWKSQIHAREPKVIRLLREFHKLMGEP
jgi:hypothetical protein